MKHLWKKSCRASRIKRVRAAPHYEVQADTCTDVAATSCRLAKQHFAYQCTFAAPAEFINKQVDTLENGLAAKQKDLAQHQRKVTADLAGEPRAKCLYCTGFYKNKN